MRSPVLTSMSYSRGGWVAADRIRQVDQLVRGLAHRADDGHDLGALCDRYARCGRPPPGSCPHRRPRCPELLDDEWHPDEATDWGPASPCLCAAGLWAAGPRGDRRSPGGLGRVSGRAQRQESPPARGRRARLAAEAQAQKRRRQIRNGASSWWSSVWSSWSCFSCPGTTTTSPCRPSRRSDDHDGGGEVGCGSAGQGQRGRREGRLPGSPQPRRLPRRTRRTPSAPPMTHRHVARPTRRRSRRRPGRSRSHLDANERTADGQQLRLPGQQGLLQLRQLLPGHPRLRDCRPETLRRPNSGNAARLHHPGRTSAQGVEPCPAVPARLAGHGQHAAQPNTGGSQFFIVSGTQGEALPNTYSLFGQVTSGHGRGRHHRQQGSASGIPPDVTQRILTVTINES